MPKYERPVEYDAVVLYDADCPYCSAATKALRRTQHLGAVAWSEDAAQSFLDAQFGDTPFAIILVDSSEDRVYVGRDAARELAERAGLPNLLSDLVASEFDHVDAVVDRFGGHERRPDDWHGTYDLTAEALAQFDSLSYLAWSLPER